MTQDQERWLRMFTNILTMLWQVNPGQEYHIATCCGRYTYSVAPLKSCGSCRRTLITTTVTALDQLPEAMTKIGVPGVRPGAKSEGGSEPT